MDVKLSEGAIEAMTKGSDVTNPLLQVVNIRRIERPTARYRLMLSDGRHSLSSFVLAGHLNVLVEEKRLEILSVCKVKKMVSNVLTNGSRVVVVLDMEVVRSAEEVGQRVGGATSPYVEGQTAPPQRTDQTTPGQTAPPQNTAMTTPGQTTPPQKTAPPQRTAQTTPGQTTPPQKTAQTTPGQTTPPQKTAQTTPGQTTPPLKTVQTTQGQTAPPQKTAQTTPGQTTPGQRTVQTAPTAPSHALAPATTHSYPRGQATPPQKPAYCTPTRSSPAAAPWCPGGGRGSGKKDPPTPGGSAPNTLPITCLNPYQTKWTIRARVTNKSSLRTWNNSRGEGKFFSFQMVDESGEIKITAFNKEADRFFSLVEAGKVYYISRGTLKIANKQYNTLKHDYEMSLKTDSTIVPCSDSPDVPMVQCDFVPIADLEHREKDAIIDVIGVCSSCEEASRIITKSSRETFRRALSLRDTSGKEVILTLWGEEAERFDGAGQPVVAVKGARLSDFGGRSLSTQFSSALMVNPDIPEAVRLRSWYDQEGHALLSQSLSEQRAGGSGGHTNWKTLSDVTTEHLGQGDQAEYLSCVATLLCVRKESCLYQACPSDDCFKKVLDQRNGLYRCDKCDRDFTSYKYRLILSANIADFGDNQWVTCFPETAEALLGQSTETLGQLKDTDQTAFAEVFEKASFTSHTFRLRVKLETYNDEARVKATVMEVKPVDHRDYSRRLISSIRRTAGPAGTGRPGVRRQLWKKD